jgi:hypothetical protein
LGHAALPREIAGTWEVAGKKTWQGFPSRGLPGVGLIIAPRQVVGPLLFDPMEGFSVTLVQMAVDGIAFVSGIRFVLLQDSPLLKLHASEITAKNVC